MAASDAPGNEGASFDGPSRLVLLSYQKGNPEHQGARANFAIMWIFLAGQQKRFGKAKGFVNHLLTPSNRGSALLRRFFYGVDQPF